MYKNIYLTTGISTLQVRFCERCQRNNHKLQKASGVLHPIPVAPKIWNQVGMDLIGPLPETPHGHKYIITLTDYFSKWAKAAAPLQDKTALGVAKFIFKATHTATTKVLESIMLHVYHFIGHVQDGLSRDNDH